MSWFNLKDPMGTDHVVDPGDIVNTKTALNRLGYYDVPPDRGIDDWTDDAMFNGIKAFQKDKGLKIDGFMRPGGPTEKAINAGLAEGDAQAGMGEGETPPFGTGKDTPREPGIGMPIGVPPNVSSNMPVLTRPLKQYHGRPYWQGGPSKKGGAVVEGIDPRNGGTIRPPRGPY